VVCIPTETNKKGYHQFQLFKRCRVEAGIDGNGLFFLEAHDDALPLMFDYKRDYFTYDLWNVLNLQSVNQFRMYELLKEYEFKGERIIAVNDLKAFLGLDASEYEDRWNNFKFRVLDVCQEALKQYTDIVYTYEPYAKAGRGGKITMLRFTIQKNPDHVDKLDLAGFMDLAEVRASVLPPAPYGPVDVSGLDFISEPISDKDKAAILDAAAGDEQLVAKTYEMAKHQGGIQNLTGWMINMIRKYKEGEISAPVGVDKINRFVNFEQRKNDYSELERLELEQFRKAVYGSKE
jgi:hypothetical protein